MYQHGTGQSGFFPSRFWKEIEFPLIDSARPVERRRKHVRDGESNVPYMNQLFIYLPASICDHVQGFSSVVAARLQGTIRYVLARCLLGGQHRESAQNKKNMPKDSFAVLTKRWDRFSRKVRPRVEWEVNDCTNGTSIRMSRKWAKECFVLTASFTLKPRATFRDDCCPPSSAPGMKTMDIPTYPGHGQGILSDSLLHFLPPSWGKRCGRCYRGLHITTSVFSVRVQEWHVAAPKHTGPWATINYLTSWMELRAEIPFRIHHTHTHTHAACHGLLGHP